MKFYPLFLSTLLSVAGFTSARAVSNIPAPDFLFIINDSDPGAVTFTATVNNPINSDASHVFYDGIDLMSLFTNPVASLPTNLTPIVTGTGLTTFIDGTPVYDSSYVDHVSGSEIDFNLYTRTIAALTTTETFDSTQQAFTGTATVDLSDYASLLPAYGAIGSVFAGYSGQNDPNSENPLVFLGDYEVIPEPSPWSLLLLGAVGLVVIQRLRPVRP